jgi:multidrug efflux system membrane fusion protein
VHLANPRDRGAYRLPLTALYQRGGKSFVWVVSPEQLFVHARQVEIGDVTQDAIVVAGGLRAGETVVTAGVHLLFEGQKVRLAQLRAEGG